MKEEKAIVRECDVWIYDFGSEAFSVAIIDNDKPRGIMIVVDGQSEMEEKMIRDYMARN